MYSFSQTNIVLFLKQLPTEIAIFINVCYHMKCVSSDRFSFLGAGFANILPAFSISWEVQTKYWKALKYSEQYILYHLSGAKVIIWICSEYDIVFNFSWIALSNLTKSFTFFSCISFLS